MPTLIHWEIQTSYHIAWHEQARCTLKAVFYAYLYGNYRATRTINDFQQMYLMGGEL